MDAWSAVWGLFVAVAIPGIAGAVLGITLRTIKDALHR
jgi:hypothetical protein